MNTFESNNQNELSVNALLKSLIRENFILKAQLGLLHDTLIDKGIIGENELQPKLKNYMAEMDEKEFQKYLIDTAQLFDGLDEDRLRN